MSEVGDRGKCSGRRLWRGGGEGVGGVGGSWPLRRPKKILRIRFRPIRGSLNGIPESGFGVKIVCIIIIMGCPGRGGSPRENFDDFTSYVRDFHTGFCPYYSSFFL